MSDLHMSPPIHATRSDEFWEIAIAVNAALKGLLGHLGQSGHVCQRTAPIVQWLDTQHGTAGFVASCANAIRAAGVIDGDVVVVAEKPLALAQGRVAPRTVFEGLDPKKLDGDGRARLAQRVSEQTDLVVDGDELIRADWYVDAAGIPSVTLGSIEQNEFCAAVAAAVAIDGGPSIDVVVSDTDTGLDVRMPIIGTLTLGATPLGSTAGLTLYETMRCAVAAEFTRGHDLGIGIVWCTPADRCRDREGRGQPRGYGGMLDRNREAGLTYA